MSGKLYIVGTPIGNLGDMTVRAVDTLRAVDFIAAEDTRVSLKLLNHFDIKKPLVSSHKHSTLQCQESIVKRVCDGESCAVITDAGMPCISDPGEDLVKMCCEAGITVEVVPGPTAALSALAVSGLSTSRFSFEGFLSTANKPRKTHLEEAARSRYTLIFYEAPHKLKATLDDMLEYFGDRKISLCRELTKIHEEIIRTTISQAVEYYRVNDPRGEYVLIVEGRQEDESSPATIEDAVMYARKLSDSGMKPSDACRESAKLTGFKKGDIYTAMLEDSDE